MSRTVLTMNCKNDFDTTYKIICDILTNNGFKFITLGGEDIWKKGTGLLSAIQFIKVEFGNKSVTLSAWIKVGLGSFTDSEMDLNGVMSIDSKRALMNILQEIRMSI